MTKNNGFKVAALAASIALAMGATSAMAATPAAGQLPGQGKVTAATAPTVTITSGTNTMGIALGSNTVINWGAGTSAGDINSTGTAGFNIGKDATVNFTGNYVVLNIDSTGNPSQIFGNLNSAGTGATSGLFVANANGIIVGASGNINGAAGVALISNTLIDNAAAFNTNSTLTNYQGAGGDVTVQPGATITSTGLIVSGGGNVNVDLTNVTGTISNISAGLHGGTNPLATDNASAAVTVAGTTAGSTVAQLASAGAATTSGTLTVTTNAAKSLTNNGVLTITTNNAKGTVTNNGTLTLPAANGTLVNNGSVTAVASSTFTGLSNAGSIGSAGGVAVAGGGNLVNTGTITGAGAVTVNNGYINNSGSIAGATAVNTTSDSTSGTGFTAGGQYYVNNAGSIGFATGGVHIDANAATRTGTSNDSTGSFTNTGTLTASAAGQTMTIAANNNVSLGGTLKAGTSALASGNALGAISLTADNGVNGTGVLTVSAPLFSSAATALSGNQVKLMKNIAATGAVTIEAGAAPSDDYSVRVASGTTTKGGSITVDGRAAGDLPSTILQGTLSADSITFGGTNTVGDVISGPAGGLVASGTTPTVVFDFAGRIKTAPYLNDPNNFRYNYLPISLATGATAPLLLTLNPVAYTTNGTSNGKSGVNVLVNGDVELTTMAIPTQASAASAVTGVTNWPNTHVVLQSTGDITMAAATYWPGYVYLGTVDSDSNGNALPGTLSDTGTIDLGGFAFNNVLPGDVAGASGIHFMSGNPLANGLTVTTNANALINFPIDLLTQNYAQGILTAPTFKGGVANGLVVNYGALDPSLFNTHPVDATK